MRFKFPIIFRKKKLGFEYFIAISDILYYSIRKQNEKLAKTISNFMYGAFKEVRDQNANKEVIYPVYYYEVVAKTIEELAIQKNKRLAFLENRTAGSIWLLGEFSNSKISDNTYTAIWRNFLLALKYDRDDFIIHHWHHAHQYISISLSPIMPIYTPNIIEIQNTTEISERRDERKKFLEFHNALGGLLLYKKRYSCIYQMFSYTQSIPPRYELLPETMDEVFQFYFSFRDPYEIRHPWISSQFPFPDLGGLNSNNIIKNWICQYIALLFIRQYSLTSYLITMEPLRFPQIPTSQGEKSLWIEHMDYFKKLVEEILENKALLHAVEFDFITPEWNEKLGNSSPLKFIDILKQKVIESFEGTQIQQNVSEEKKRKFKETTSNLLKPVFDEYNKINNKERIEEEANKWFIHGLSDITEKRGFADNQESTHLNFDSYLAESLSHKFKNGISEIFVFASTQTYLLNSQDILPTLQKLNFPTDDYIAISFGVDLKQLESTTGETLLVNLKTFNFPFRNFQLLGDSIFILKQSDLPSLIYHEVTEDEVHKFSLEKVIEEYNLYVTVIDLNKKAEVRNFLFELNNEKDLLKSVYLAIFLKLEVRWKKNAQIIQLKLFSHYSETGIPNNLSDIKPLF